MSQRILLVEDDATLKAGLTETLTQEGFAVTALADGKAAQATLTTRGFDLLILDLMLPGRGGLEILRELRAKAFTVPVLILTARADESDKVLGLELGADDYVTKPFSLRELVARVRALLRRPARLTAGTRGGGAATFQLGRAHVDLGTFQVTRGKKTFPLSAKEAAMLALLHGEGGRAVDRERFLEEVWGSAEFVGDRTVDTHVFNLRKKLEDDPRKPRHLVTVHGIGYRLVP